MSENGAESVIGTATLWMRIMNYITTVHFTIHRVSKNCAKLLLSELHQISTDFDNFWQNDGKEARIMQIALIFYLI